MQKENEYKKLTIEDYRYANIPDLYFTIDLKSIIDKYFISKELFDEFYKFVDNLFNNGGSVFIVGGSNHIDRTAIGVLVLRFFRRRYRSCFYINGSELYEYMRRYDKDSELVDRLYYDDVILIDDIDVKLFDFVQFTGLFKQREDRKLTTLCIFSGDKGLIKLKYNYFLLDLDDVYDKK